MPEIIPHSGLTLLDAFRAARDAGMHLIDNGLGDVRVSPIIPPGWREIPIKIKVTAADPTKFHTIRRTTRCLHMTNC